MHKKIADRIADRCLAIARKDGIATANRWIDVFLQKNKTDLSQVSEQVKRKLNYGKK